MFDTVKVGRIISQKRKEHNMTQMQLVDALGISFQAVSNWERGNSMPDISKLPELAELFGCSIEELLGGGASAGNVEKLAKGEGQGLSLGEIAEVAPVLTPEVLDEAVESARRETPSAACGDSSFREGAEESEEEGFDEDIEEEIEDGFDEDIEEEIEDEEEDEEEPRRFHAFWKRTGRGARAHIRDGKTVYILGAEKSGEKRKDKDKCKRLKELVMLAPFLSSARLRELVEELRGEGYTVSELVPLAPSSRKRTSTHWQSSPQRTAGSLRRSPRSCRRRRSKNSPNAAASRAVSSSLLRPSFPRKRSKNSSWGRSDAGSASRAGCIPSSPSAPSWRS